MYSHAMLAKAVHCVCMYVCSVDWFEKKKKKKGRKERTRTKL